MRQYEKKILFLIKIGNTIPGPWPGFFRGGRSEKSGPQGVRLVRPGPHFLTKSGPQLSVGGVRAHPLPPLATGLYTKDMLKFSVLTFH